MAPGPSAEETLRTAKSPTLLLLSSLVIWGEWNQVSLSKGVLEYGCAPRLSFSKEGSSWAGKFLLSQGSDGLVRVGGVSQAS